MSLMKSITDAIRARQELPVVSFRPDRPGLSPRSFTPGRRRHRYQRPHIGCRV